MRERSYIQVARLSGMPGPMIIFERNFAQSTALSGRIAGDLDFRGGAGVDWSWRCLGWGRWMHPRLA